MCRQTIICIVETNGGPNPFLIVEMGAGTGALAKDVLTEWDRLQQASKSPINSNMDEQHQATTDTKEREMAHQPDDNTDKTVDKTVDTRYIIVEQSPILREKQKETTMEIARERMEWHSTLQEIPDYGLLVGVIVSNELFDALPVHRLVFEEGRLQERYVILADSQAEGEPPFTEVTGPLSDDGLASVLPEEMMNVMEEGDRFEVSPHWGRVMKQMTGALKQGSIMTIDYGDTAPDVYWNHAHTGGIRCYFKQALVTDPYERIGQQDITADVDFSYLQRVGESAGFETIWFTNQSEFLENLGFLDKVQQLQRMAFKDLRADFEMQRMLTLYLPQNGLGDACKVLIQRKE